MGKTKASKKSNDDMNDWIASLAKQSASANPATSNAPTLSKEERKQKRAAKKALRQQKQQRREEGRVNPAFEQAQRSNSKSRHTVDLSRRRLKQLGKVLSALRSSHNSGRSQRPFRPDEEQPSKKRKRPLNEETIQPRPSDYSGIGLARESLFISFLDPSHIPKLEEEFHEHIPGFFGKQRTKAMKRQLDGDMLWRKMAQQKKKGMPKKFAGLSPDDRVQAMIDAGML